MRNNSSWRNHDYWICRNHLPVAIYPAGITACWYAGCKSVRPAEEKRPEKIVVEAPVVVEEEPEVEVCAWKDCENAARPNSKYCSRSCSNKNARARFRARKKDDDAEVSA